MYPLRRNSRRQEFVNNFLRLCGQLRPDTKGRSAKTAALAVDCLFDAMTEALARGDRVELRGFGSWIAKPYGAKIGRNPKTGQSISVPAKRLPYFKAGKDLANRLINAGQREQEQQ